MSTIKLIERAGNFVLSLDPETAEQISSFTDKVFCIELVEPSFTIYLLPCIDGFTLEKHITTQADVTLSGSMLSFVKLAREGAHSDVFHTGRIRMTGDAELGQAFQNVMMQLDIDWEEITSKFVGDFASRQIHRVFDEVSSWFGKSKTQFKQNLGEVLQEEWRTVPSPVEVERFTTDIEKLRADTDRLQARIEQFLSTKKT